MQDRPTVHELLDAIQRFLDSEIVPATEGRRQFLVRVAANTLRIIDRELEAEEEQLARESAGLEALLGAGEGTDLPPQPPPLKGRGSQADPYSGALAGEGVDSPLPSRGGGPRGGGLPFPTRSTLRETIRQRSEELSARIRAGWADTEPERSRVVAHLRQTVQDKLLVTNRAYLVDPDDRAKEGATS